MCLCVAGEVRSVGALALLCLVPCRRGPAGLGEGRLSLEAEAEA